MIKKTIFLIFLSLSVVVLNQKVICQMQSPMPAGDWQVSIKPSLLNSPITVTSINSDAQRGLAVTKITLAFSEIAKRKPVAKIRMGWVVIDESKNGSIIGTGESGIIFLNSVQGRSIRLNSTIFSFASFAESIGLNTLNGRFRVDILVSSVEFANGENWKFDLPKSNSLNTQYVKASRKINKKGEACPNQSCYWNRSLGSYQCEADNGFSCTNAANGLSCNETKCGSGGGDLDLLM